MLPPEYRLVSVSMSVLLISEHKDMGQPTGKRLEIRPDDRGHPTLLGLPSDFRQSRLTLPQRLLEPLDRDGQAHFAAMSEAVIPGTTPRV
jgi:hypothetical protein